MKRPVAAAIALLFGTVGAIAADLPVKAPGRAALAYSWAGFYAGGNIGYGWGEARNDWDVYAPDIALNGTALVCRANGGFALCISGSDKARMEGVIGGLQAGYNWISGKYLLGLEGDVQYSDRKANQTFNGTFPTGGSVNGIPVPGYFVATYSESLQWLGTLRGRVGVVNDRWAFYATGGLAVGEVRINGSAASATNIPAPANCSPIPGVTLAASCPFGTFSNSETRVGWTLGAGIEGMISSNWSWKVEYLHVDLGRSEARYATPTGCFGGFLVQPQSAGCSTYAPGRGSVSGRFTDEIVRVGINYHFAATAPVVAKY